MGAPEWVLLLALAGIWGSSFFFYKVLVSTIPPFTVVLARVGIAALVLHFVLFIQRRPMSLSLPWRSFFLLGLLNCAVPFSLFVWGETRVSSGVASILNAMTPIFTIIVAHFFTPTEKLTTNRCLGIILGVCGVAVLMGPTAVTNLSSGNLFGEALCLLATLFYGFGTVYGRRFKGIPAVQVATGLLTTSTIIILPLAVYERFWTLPMPTLPTWGAFAGIALLCTVIAYILFFKILARAGATNVTLVTLIMPIVALLLGYFVLHERFRLTSFIGMALIGVSLIIIDGRLYTSIHAILAKRPRI